MIAMAGSRGGAGPWPAAGAGDWGVASSSVKSRPARMRAPSTLNTFGVAAPAWICSGSPFCSENGVRPAGMKPARSLNKLYMIQQRFRHRTLSRPRILRRHADQGLAEVPAFEQTDERPRRGVETVDDVLAVLDSSVTDERHHLLQERREAIVVIADDEPADHRAVHEQRTQIGPAGILRDVVLRDHSAERNACELVQQSQHRGKDGAADVFEIHVNALRARIAQRVDEVVGLVVHARVEPELVDNVAALLCRSRDADRATPFDLRELTDDGADR